MSTEFSCILLEIDAPVATITINRPKALNALNDVTINELDEAIGIIEDSDEVQAVIITGAGKKAFVAGADISRMPDMDKKAAEEFSKQGSKVFRRLEQLPVPVVAAVNGFALGGGCELMLACDFAYASEKARFGQPEVNLGIIAGFGGTQRLARKVPYGMAMELLMNAEMIDAAEAHRIGLVNKVCAPEDLMDEVHNGLKNILKRAPIAVELTKKAVQEGLNTDIDAGLEIESENFAEAFDTKDASEGVQAFLEKRTPEFRGQ
jgi:enoyl-CoA hydratase